MSWFWRSWKMFNLHTHTPNPLSRPAPACGQNKCRMSVSNLCVDICLQPHAKCHMPLNKSSEESTTMSRRWCTSLTPTKACKTAKTHQCVRVWMCVCMFSFLLPREDFTPLACTRIGGDSLHRGDLKCGPHRQITFRGFKTLVCTLSFVCNFVC